MFFLRLVNGRNIFLDSIIHELFILLHDYKFSFINQMNNTKFAMCHYDLIVIFLLYKSKQHRLILLLLAKNIQVDQIGSYTDQLLQHIKRKNRWFRLFGN